jgi:hypothetical protein
LHPTHRLFPRDGYRAWLAGDSFEDALPDESPAAIRFLETGICEHCYNKEVHCDDTH